MWRWYDSLDKLDLEDWMGRLMAMPRPSPFLSPSFLRPWAQVFATEVRAGLWKDEGLALFHRTSVGWELLGGQEVADRLDVLGRDPAMWAELREDCSRWGGPIVFPNLGPESQALHHVREGDELSQTDSSPYLLLDKDFGGFLARLTRKSRHELKRKLNRAERLTQGALTVKEGYGQLESFLHLHRRSHPEKAIFMQGRMERFFRLLCASLDESGMLWLASLTLGDRVLASILQIRFSGVAHLYNSGYDPDVSELSPGLVLIARCVAQACDQGLSEYDFLRGTERYKYDLGGVDRPVYRLTWPAPAG